MARGQSNTNGVTPLADTGTGAAGTVLGTERSKLQNFPATAQSSNVASTIVSRDANGDFAGRNITGALLGNATTASNLATGTTDGDKVHRLGTALTATLGSNLATSGSYQIIAIALPVGKWLVTGQLVATGGGATNARFDGSVHSPTLGEGLVPLAVVNTTGTDRAASLPGVVFDGGQTVYLSIYQSGTCTVYGGVTTFGGAPSSPYTWMQAVCVG